MFASAVWPQAAQDSLCRETLDSAFTWQQSEHVREVLRAGTSKKAATSPGQLVTKLAPELSPTLVQDGTVQTGRLSHISAGFLDGAASAAPSWLHVKLFDDVDAMLLRCDADHPKRLAI